MGAGRTPEGRTALSEAGHGTLLAGRYRLEERLRAGADSSTWRALDETLDRPVGVRLLAPGHRHAADTVDAARRAALVEDPRLVRVLDVGAQPEGTYVVHELSPGRSLADAVAGGPLPAPSARRIAGEAAQALDRAAARGLHHLRLTPRSVFLDRDGSVKIAGIAVDAAEAGADAMPDRQALREDAVGLVSLLYAALTGRWPGVGFGGVPQAPRAEGVAVPPADLVPEVPNDLDTLCAVSLGPLDDGPRSPRELADQLAPWDAHEPLPAVSQALEPGLGYADDEDDQDDQDDEPYVAAHAEPEPQPRHATAAPTVLNGPVPRVDIAAALAERDRLTAGGSAAHRGSAPQAVAEAPAPVWYPPAEGPSRRTGGAPLGAGRNPEPAPSGGWNGLGTPADGEQFLGPFLPPAPIARPPREQSRFVLVLVAAVVAVVLAVALWSLRDFGSARSQAASPRASANPSPSSTGPAATRPAGSATPSPSSTAPAVPVRIADATPIDPKDGVENNGSVGRAFDGDPGTSWQSSGYTSSTFGGLKDGLGLRLALADAATVHQVTVSMKGSGGTFELRTGDGQEGGDVLATGSDDGGTLTLTPATPVRTDRLVLWCTELPRVSGQNKMVVKEIEVR